MDNSEKITAIYIRGSWRNGERSENGASAKEGNKIDS